MSKLVIISYELPIILEPAKDKSYLLTPVSHARTGGLENFHKKRNTVWFGRPGLNRGDLSTLERDKLSKAYEDKNCYPVYLGKKEHERYLEGFSNRTIWPLFHYFTQNAIYREELWKAYVKVNHNYAEEVIPHLKAGDSIWIQDYHLMLLPKMIREKFPDVSIGFFQHIPFPSYEIFRLLPWRREILEGLLGSDLVGFHTYDYERHFMSCVRRLLGYDSVFNRIHLEERIVKVDFFPLGIDYDKFSQEGKEIFQREKAEGLSRELIDQQLSSGDKKIILSIDRLDYTKGITVRLKAYEYFLKSHPEYHEKVSLLFFVMPSRESMEHYKTLKKDMDELVGRINSTFGSLTWMPVWYFYRQLDFHERIELYCQSDIALITPIRDGMNLIAKEFLATRAGRTGVLIISETAGASKELAEAHIVNPNNRLEISESILNALEMPEDVQISRNKLLCERLRNHNVERWADDFFHSLKEVKKIQEIKLARKFTGKMMQNLSKSYGNSGRRILFLDYDGTLMGFNKDPQKANPDKELYQILKLLSETQGNKVVIISGRDKETLGRWFPADEWKLDIVAEHGVWSREPGSDWGMIELIERDWMDIIRPILEFYVDRTPQSFIETKNYSLVWHYRNTDPDLGSQRSWELKDELKALVANLNLEIMDGDKVIEIKNSGINKGRATTINIGESIYDFIMAIGDDWTDEYTFDVLPENAYTIKVGTKTTKADYYVDGVSKVREILKELAELVPPQE
ncbi:bifunctional alpha,alpha-trehalose-phosphate synthase (UDP-forming)/trehalose-phosphatase [Bacteroidota bacterium]